jgi:hypothetical protein
MIRPRLTMIKIRELICGLLCAGSLQAVVVRHDVDVSAYHALAGQAPFAPVVRIEVATAFGTRTGSGVVVGDGWVLTAAHVVWGAAPDAIGVRTTEGRAAAQELRVTPGWSAAPATGLTQVADLALIRVEGLGGRPPAMIATTVGSGMVGFFGGYGRMGNGILGAVSSPSLAFAMNVIDRRLSLPGGGWLVTDFDDGGSARNSLNAATVRRTNYDAGFGNPLLSEFVLGAEPGTSVAGFGALPTAADFFPGLADAFLEGTTASGDSGGPMFIFDPASDTWQLAGLVSWGVNPLLPAGFARTDSRYGDLAFFTDLTQHREWIGSVIPEPVTVVLLATGALVTTLRRRRLPDPRLPGEDPEASLPRR